jgi:hypothetical protein
MTRMYWHMALSGNVLGAGRLRDAGRCLSGNALGHSGARTALGRPKQARSKGSQHANSLESGLRVPQRPETLPDT